jgi:hypothetical protein
MQLVDKGILQENGGSAEKYKDERQYSPKMSNQGLQPKDLTIQLSVL